METLLDGRLKILQGDITECSTDAVVNAANGSLRGGGGVDGAIHRKGGPDILRECMDIRQHRYPEGLPQGKAVITSAGKLPSKYVIHTVSPVWKDGSKNEKEILSMAYKNSLRIATETGLNSIAFPSISTGVCGFPRDIAASVVYKTIKNYLQKKKSSQGGLPGILLRR